MSYPVTIQTVVAAAAMAVYIPAQNAGNQIYDFMVKLKTHTPGLGTLLCTLRYDDGEGPQDLNVALTLTAGGYAVAAWPNEWYDTSKDVELEFSYLAGLVSGSCDVEIQCRNV